MKIQNGKVDVAVSGGVENRDGGCLFNYVAGRQEVDYKKED